MPTPEFNKNFIAYNLALDATEAKRKCLFFHRWLSKNPEKIASLPDDLRYQYLDEFFTKIGNEQSEIPLKIPAVMARNLTDGKPFRSKALDYAKSAGLSYTPEAYRAFMNLFAHLHFKGGLFKEFASHTFLEFGLVSYQNLGLIADGEWNHLPKTGFQLVSNTILDFTNEEEAFMPNKKIFTIASDAQDLPRAVAGRPIVLLHGRFNGFLAINYLEAIFSIVTRFPELPCLIIGIDEDNSSRILENQAPFMNQLFRAGFYTFLPLVDGVFLADRNAHKNFDEYWGGVYREMDIDYLVLEEKDPRFDKKKERLEASTSGKASVLPRKSEFFGIKRLSGSEIKSSDPRTVRAAVAQWRGALLDLSAKYFKGGSPSGSKAAVIDSGNNVSSIQLPLLMP